MIDTNQLIDSMQFINDTYLIFALKLTFLFQNMAQGLQLITDLGGILGLRFEIVMVTFMEGIEFLVDLLVLAASKLIRRLKG